MTNTAIIHTDIKQVSEYQWDTLLESNTANFFQTKKAMSFFKAAGVETFVFALEEDEDIKVMLCGIIQKEKGMTSTFTRRAIIYGGPIFSKNVNEEQILEVLEVAITTLKKKAIYIEIRNLNDYSSYAYLFEKVGFEYVPHLNFHLDCSDETEMQKRISSSKKRQIKKSLKAGAELIEAQTRDHIETYYAILEDLYKEKVKTPLPDLQFFIAMWEEKAAKFLLVQYQKEIVGGIVCPIFKNEVIYEWFVCGKDREYKNVYPSILATWSAMEYAVKNKIPRFDFMGAGKPDEDYGVRDFKSKFGGELVEHGRFLFVAQPILYGLGKTAVKFLKGKK